VPPFLNFPDEGCAGCVWAWVRRSELFTFLLLLLLLLLLQSKKRFSPCRIGSWANFVDGLSKFLTLVLTQYRAFFQWYKIGK